jgi:hypothetical protein
MTKTKHTPGMPQAVNRTDLVFAAAALVHLPDFP